MRVTKSVILFFVPLIVVFCFYGVVISYPQTAPQSGPSSTKRTSTSKPPAAATRSRKPITVDDVTSMVQAGLSEDLVITKLRRAGQVFDLSTDEMVKLKKAGVSEAIILVMLDPKAEPRTPATPPPAQLAPVAIPSPIYPAVLTGASPSGATPSPGTPNAVIAAGENNPDAPHDSGIYWYAETKGGEKKMAVLERASYQGGKTGGMFGTVMTMGIKKAKWKAVLSGQQASLRITDARPVFYFYFEEKSAGLGKSYFGMQNISNPNQFALIKLDAKSSSRETIVMEMGAFGASSGTHEKSMIPFKAERLRPGVYRVIPTAAMERGEYCFLASSFGGGMAGTGGAATAADIFDFSIIPE